MKLVSTVPAATSVGLEEEEALVVMPAASVMASLVG